MSARRFFDCHAKMIEIEDLSLFEKYYSKLDLFGHGDDRSEWKKTLQVLRTATVFVELAVDFQEKVSKQKYQGRRSLMKIDTLQGTRVCRRMGTRCRRKIVTKRA